MSLSKKNLRNGLFTAAVGLCAGITSHNVHAAALALLEQSTTYLGNAYSGTASTAEDASTGYYNPAGLVYLDNKQLLLSTIYIDGSIKLYNATATRNNGSAVVANSVTYPSSHALLPSAFLSWRINNNWGIGFGICSPFGLGTSYSDYSVASYMATKSQLKMVDFTPSVAYKFNEQWSLGLAFDAMRVNGTLASDIFASPLLGAGYVVNKGNGWAYGYHGGVIYKPSSSVRMGLVYHSRFDIHASGYVQSRAYPPVPLPVPGFFTTTINLPDRITYSVTYQYSPEWTALADVSWTHWSRVKQILLDYNTGATALEILDLKNAFRFSFGVNYRYTSAWLFKAGVCFDQTPVTDAHRGARMPDSDRYWVALGVKYEWSKAVSFDLAYAHIFFKGCTIAQRGTGSSVAKVLNGNYHSQADLFGAQLTWSFM